MNHYLFECTTEFTYEGFCIFSEGEQFIVKADDWDSAKGVANMLTDGNYDFLYMMEGTEAATSGVEVY